MASKKKQNVSKKKKVAKKKQPANEPFESRQALEASHCHFVNLYDFAPVGYLTLDTEGSIHELNLTAARMLGQARESITGKAFSTHLVKEDVSRFFDYLHEIGKGERDSINLTILHAQQGPIGVRLETVQICNVETAVCTYRVAIIDISAEKDAEQALHRKESEFQLITDNLPILIAYVDDEQHYRFNNRTYAKWFGYTPEETYGRPIKSILGETVYQKVQGHIKTVLSGEMVTFETAMLDGKGGKRYLHVTYVPHCNKQGEAQGFFVLGTDITKRVETEETLKKERDFAEGLVTTAQMIVLELDPQGRIVSINPYLEKLSGYRQHEVVGKDWAGTFLPADDHNKIQNIFEEAITGTETKGNINPILTRDGEQRYIEWYDTTLKDKQGNITGLLAVGQDITGHIHLQKLLQESEARYRSLAENSTDMITSLDSNGIYLYVSPASLTLQGFEPGELTGESFYKYVHPDDLNTARQNFEKVLQQEESVLSTLRLLHKHGHHIWAEINSAPVLNKESGTTVEVISIVRNITEQKNIELRENKYFLEHAHESRVNSMGEMTTEIAHELNQPLSAISIYSDAAINLLPAESAENKDLVKALHEIKKQANRAGEIIHRLRELVSKKGLHHSTIDINELINGLVRLIEVETRWHKCKLQLDLAESLPVIYADYVLIEQAILNIVRNGIEAMEGIQEDQRVLTISTAQNSSNEIELEISDTGPGMSAAQIKQAFQSFYTTKPSGMGMGLSITQTIVKSHGGRIWAIPNDRGGTSFILTIPVKNLEEGE